MHSFLLCLLLCFSSDTGRLATTLDSLVAPHFQGNVPGMAVLVAGGGKILYQKAFGSADVELAAPLRSEMVFEIGSVSKQFTAVGLLHFVEQGRVGLGDPIQQYIKDYPVKGRRITSPVSSPRKNISQRKTCTFAR